MARRATGTKPVLIPLPVTGITPHRGVPVPIPVGASIPPPFVPQTTAPALRELPPVLVEELGRILGEALDLGLIEGLERVKRETGAPIAEQVRRAIQAWLNANDSDRAKSPRPRSMPTGGSNDRRHLRPEEHRAERRRR